MNSKALFRIPLIYGNYGFCSMAIDFFLIKKYFFSLFLSRCYQSDKIEFLLMLTGNLRFYFSLLLWCTCLLLLCGQFMNSLFFMTFQSIFHSNAICQQNGMKMKNENKKIVKEIDFYGNLTFTRHQPIFLYSFSHRSIHS